MDKNIELRAARTFGEVLGDTFAIFRHAIKILVKGLFMIAGPPLLILALFSSILNLIQFDFLTKMMSGIDMANPETFFTENMLIIIASAVLLGILFMVVTIAAMVFIQLIGYEYMVLYKENDFRNITVKDLWHAVRKDFWMMLRTDIGLGFIIFLPFVIFFITTITNPFMFFLLFLVGFPAMIYLRVALSFVPIIRINEGIGFFSSIGRSFKLIGGYWWSTFLLHIIFFFIILIISIALAMPYYAVLGLYFFHKVSAGQGSIIMMIMFVISNAFMMLTYFLEALPNIGISFQYFSIAERKEGARLLEKIEEVQ